MESIAVAVVLEQGKVLFIRETLAMGIDREQLFEKSAESFDFKRREMNDGEKTVTEYYTDKYLITKERRDIEGQSTSAENFLNNKALDVYSVMKVE